MSGITILHTNDLHNRLDAASAGVLSAEKAGRQDALLLDAGDAAWAGNIYFRPGGEPILGLMSAAGYDCMAVGNREFHFTEHGFQSKLSQASYAKLCANVRPASGASLPVAPSVLLQRCGITVGIFGLTVPMVVPHSRVAAFSAYVFDDPIQCGVRMAGELRERCDLLIALTHIGLAQDRRLAQEAPAIDIIVGGHSHNKLEHGEVVNGVRIVQTGAHGRFYGVVELEKNSARWDSMAELRPLRGEARP